MSAFKILICASTGKRPLGRPNRRSRWVDNIRTDLRVICINTRNSVDSAQHSKNSYELKHKISSNNTTYSLYVTLFFVLTVSIEID